MRHVTWSEGARGLGIDAVRGFLRTYYADLLAIAARKGEAIDLPASGAFDAALRRWVGQFQVGFNRSTAAAAARIKAHLPHGRLPETGEVDWRTRRVMGIDEALASDDAILLPGGVVARLSPLTAMELAAAKPGERFVGSAYRVDGLDTLLAAIGLAGRPVGTTSDKRIAPLADGRFVVPQHHALAGEAKAKSECAALVQSLGAASTERWRRGPRVQDIAVLAPGTVIATLGTGVYLSDYSGRSHVGIFLWQDALGLAMLDQFVGDGGTLGIRYKPFGAPHPRTRVPASRLIDPGYSYRMEVVDGHGNAAYARDYSLATVRTRTNLIGDGSEYYVLLDDGHVARRQSSADRLRTPEERREVAREAVREIFKGLDVMGSRDNAERLRRALEGVKPAQSR